jgi:hypothetical protein
MTNKMQIFGLFICTQSVLRVSGDVFAHHQEHLTVFTASDIQVVHLRCCRPVSWTRWNLIHDTGRPQRRCTISEAVNTVKFSSWWAKTSPEIFRADWVQINQNLHLVGHQLRNILMMMHGHTNIKIRMYVCTWIFQWSTRCLNSFVYVHQGAVNFVASNFQAISQNQISSYIYTVQCHTSWHVKMLES